MVDTRSHSALKETPHLLQYPGEIRNLIYRFVLSSPYPLHYYASETFGCPGLLCEPGRQDLKRHVNQLKYVNHQLHTETSDLELRFNDVYISQEELGWVGRNAGAIFPFLEDIRAPRLSWLKTVTIRPPKLDVHREWKKAIATRADLAQLFPDEPLPTIHFVLPSLTPGPGMPTALFMMHGLAISWKLRGNGPSWALLHMVCEEARAEIREQITGMEHLHFLLPQFRLLPNQKEINASWIRCAVRDVPKSAELCGRLLRHWIYHAAKWTRNGM
ncbi:hypothetical protein BDU57DRAFT_515881 [Ampelomyces quisqualis]|uniref:Uncharacterized protein n=1 Tax=Ampelomyces quisqualis TaxID=50730 RepID=A0A6A5QKZ2_AMPQU|nr:hypothetical protein BDU57DRAFT_515881 [Ampelomyces quisqualis]